MGQPSAIGLEFCFVKLFACVAQKKTKTGNGRKKSHPGNFLESFEKNFSFIKILRNGQQRKITVSWTAPGRSLHLCIPNCKIKTRTTVD